jgi:tetratricopeptide (TPR) repeat protein
MRVVACVLSAALLALAPDAALVGASQQKPTPSLSTRQALDQYLKGDFEAAVGNPPRLARFNFQDADRWITAGGQAQVERRQLAAALYVLEYSGIRQGVLPAMLNWARGVMSRLPPRADEALWLRAAIALAEGLDRWVYLVEGVAGPAASGKPAVAPVGLIRFARTRFPDDPYFQLADAVGAEVSATRPLDQLSGPPQESSAAWDRIASERLDGGGPRLSERTVALERAAGLLERLTTHAALAAEANLRLGYVRLRQGQTDTALAHFDRALGLTKNISIRYLSHLYSGWLLGSLGRTQEAASAYRAALALVPRAQSATSLLVALLAKSDQLTEAEAAAETFLTAEVAPLDPWRTYFVSDFREYPQLVQQLRERLR